MGRLNRSAVFELLFWLVLAGFLFAYTFEFDREIEIYRYGASAWPRAVIALVVIAAVGQAIQTLLRSGQTSADAVPSQEGDVQGSVDENSRRSIAWFAMTFFLIAIPFVYMVAPTWIAKAFAVDKVGVNTLKLVFAGGLLVIYLLAVRRNHLGGMLSVPILFAALMQDFGFYALAPLFVLAVMFLMGERRPGRMVGVALFTLAVILTLFVSILYVGLPTGNIPPFYEFGTTVVKWLQ